MRTLLLAALLALCGGAAQAQADSDIAACLLAQQGLDPVYRDTMEETCLRVAGDSCARTEWPLPCLEGLRAELRAAFAAWRPFLPETVEGARLSQRTYPNRLASIDTAQADTSCQAETTALDLVRCEIIQGFSALLGILTAARVAEVTLE